MPQLSYYLPVLISGQNESELGPKHFYSREHFLFLAGSLISTIFSLVDILNVLFTSLLQAYSTFFTTNKQFFEYYVNKKKIHFI